MSDRWDISGQHALRFTFGGLTKPGRRGANQKLQKVAAGSTATGRDPYDSVRMFGSPPVPVTPGANPWDLNTRSFTPIASATTDSLRRPDVLTMITPPPRRGEASPTPCAPSSNGSPSMKGLAQRMVKVWLNSSDWPANWPVKTAPAADTGLDGDEDELMPFRGNIFENIRSPSRIGTGGDMFSPQSRPPRIGARFTTPQKQQKDTDDEPTPARSNCDPLYIFGLGPNVQVVRGKSMPTSPPKFRGASTGSTMPSGPAVAQWRRNSAPTNRAVSDGFMENPQRMDLSDCSHLTRKQTILFEEEDDYYKANQRLDDMILM